MAASSKSGFGVSVNYNPGIWSRVSSDMVAQKNRKIGSSGLKK